MEPGSGPLSVLVSPFTRAQRHDATRREITRVGVHVLPWPETVMTRGGHGWQRDTTTGAQ